MRRLELNALSMLPRHVPTASATGGASRPATVPHLQHNLDRVLFSPGVHYLRDPRTGHFNFDASLHKLTPPPEFNFGLLAPFVPACRDASLHALARHKQCAFASSTSAIAPSLSMLYQFISRGRLLHLEHLSQAFAQEPRTFTLLNRQPIGVVLERHSGSDASSSAPAQSSSSPSPISVWSVVAEKPLEEVPTVLSQLGHSIERLLTTSPAEYRQYLRAHADEDPKPERDSAYTHTQMGAFLLRSQLDCQDGRLPRRTFDLKTRATLPVRMDVLNYHKYLAYKVRTPHGLFESYEREFYDMARSTMLKYNFQVRIGDMDGIFVAYHNTDELFGFQYVPRETMDACLYGSSAAGDAAFSIIFQLYHAILETALAAVPASWQRVRLTAVLAKDAVSKLTVYVDDGEGAAVGATIKSFTVTGHLTNRGLRTEQLDVKPRQCLSDVAFHATLSDALTSIHRQEFLAARQHVLDPRSRLASSGREGETPEINERIMRMLLQRQQENVLF